MEPTQLYTTAEVLALAKIKSRSTIWTWAEKGWITPVKLGVGHRSPVRYTAESVEAFIQRSTVAPEAVAS